MLIARKTLVVSHARTLNLTQNVVEGEVAGHYWARRSSSSASSAPAASNSGPLEQYTDDDGVFPPDRFGAVDASFRNGEDSFP